MQRGSTSYKNYKARQNNPAFFEFKLVLNHFSGGSAGKESAMWETWVWSLGWADPLAKGMATHSSILAWRIPWTEKRGWLQSMGLQRVRHDWATEPNWNDGFPGGSDGKESACNSGDLGLILGSWRSAGEGNNNPLQYSCLENSMDEGVWQAAVHGFSNSGTWLSN